MDTLRQTDEPSPTADGESPSIPRGKRWQPPRGIRLIDLDHRPDRPFAVQWRVDGQRKTKTFKNSTDRLKFAQSLAGGLKRDGLDALRLDPDETRRWRAFRAEIGAATLDDVLRVWRRYGSVAQGLKLSAVIPAFLKAKEGEGIAAASLGHLRPVLRSFLEAIGDVDVATVERTQLEDYIANLETESAETRRTHFKRVRTLFNWLRETRQIGNNPCDGWKAPREAIEKISVMPVPDGVKFFSANASAPNARELLGRLALEAFAGVRHETAAEMSASCFDFETRVITIPAEIDKNRQEQFIEHAPDNVWVWLKWSNPAKWSMNAVQYRNAKSLAFTRANVPHPKNVLRHSAASYHIALMGDAGRTAAMLTHANLKMLWSRYRGKGGGKANGEAWYSILPPEAPAGR